MAYILVRIRRQFTFNGVIGAIEGLLLVRLMGLLFAARPDNPVFELVYVLSAPLVWPWTWLDRWAEQPSFPAARLELATLAAMVVVAVLAGLWARYRGGRTEGREDRRG